MKRILFFSIVFMLCMSLAGLSGCAFLRQDTLRAQGKHITVLGAWGLVDATNAAITITGSTEGTNFKKKENPKLMVTPSIQEMGPVPINIGKPIDPSEMMQPESDTTSAVTSLLGGVNTASSAAAITVPDAVTK